MQLHTFSYSFTATADNRNRKEKTDRRFQRTKKQSNYIDTLYAPKAQDKKFMLA